MGDALANGLRIQSHRPPERIAAGGTLVVLYMVEGPLGANLESKESVSQGCRCASAVAMGRCRQAS